MSISFLDFYRRLYRNLVLAARRGVSSCKAALVREFKAAAPDDLVWLTFMSVRNSKFEKFFERQIL